MNEVALSIHLAVEKGAVQFEALDEFLVSFIADNPVCRYGTQNIATGGMRLINCTDLTMGGYMLFKNNGTDYVELSPDNSVSHVAIRLVAGGGIAVFRAAAGITLYAYANSGTQQLEYWMLDE